MARLRILPESPGFPRIKFVGAFTQDARRDVVPKLRRARPKRRR